MGSLQWHHSGHDKFRRGGKPCRRLKDFPWLETARTLRERFREDHLGLTASSLTFTTVISLVPLFTVLLAVFSAFPAFDKLQGVLQQWLIDSLFPDIIARQVLGYLNQFSAKASRVGAVGFALLLVTALVADPHHRQHAQRHLARAPGAAAGAARADVLGGADARAAGAGRPAGRSVLRRIGLAWPGQCPAGGAGPRAGSHGIRPGGRGRRGLVPLRAEHARCAGATPWRAASSWPWGSSWPRKDWRCT